MEVQIAREQVVAPTVVEPVGMAAAIASALAGEPAPTEERTLTAAALTTVATAAALTAAAGQTNVASVEDLRRCCEQAPRKGEHGVSTKRLSRCAAAQAGKRWRSCNERCVTRKCIHNTRL